MASHAPHPSAQEWQNAQIPHILGTQIAANMEIMPHKSPTCPGVGKSVFTLTGALDGQDFCTEVPTSLSIHLFVPKEQ